MTPTNAVPCALCVYFDARVSASTGTARASALHHQLVHVSHHRMCAGSSDGIPFTLHGVSFACSVREIRTDHVEAEIAVWQVASTHASVHYPSAVHVDAQDAIVHCEHGRTHTQQLPHRFDGAIHAQHLRVVHRAATAALADSIDHDAAMRAEQALEEAEQAESRAKVDQMLAVEQLFNLMGHVARAPSVARVIAPSSTPSAAASSSSSASSNKRAAAESEHASKRARLTRVVNGQPMLLSQAAALYGNHPTITELTQLHKDMHAHVCSEPSLGQESPWIAKGRAFLRRVREFALIVEPILDAYVSDPTNGNLAHQLVEDQLAHAETEGEYAILAIATQCRISVEQLMEGLEGPSALDHFQARCMMRQIAGVDGIAALHRGCAATQAAIAAGPPLLHGLARGSIQAREVARAELLMRLNRASATSTSVGNASSSTVEQIILARRNLHTAQLQLGIDNPAQLLEFEHEIEVLRSTEANSVPNIWTLSIDGMDQSKTRMPHVKREGKE
jgi:hypothetical protein